MKKMTEKEVEDGGGDGNSVKNACGQGGDDWSQDPDDNDDEEDDDESNN